MPRSYDSLMFLPEPYCFDSRHWGFAFVLAATAHITLFLSYQPGIEAGVKEVSHRGIVIGLKKVTLPPQVELSPVVQQKIEPLPKPEAKFKPKTEISPVVKSEEINEAGVDIFNDDNIQNQENPSVLDNSFYGSVDPGLKLNYETQLLAWLERHKRYPNFARRRGQQGTVILEFVMSAEGELLSHKLLQVSAYASLNEAIDKMIKRASPMPSVPHELRRNRTKFLYTVPIHFKLNKGNK
jgi:TonB family protein